MLPQSPIDKERICNIYEYGPPSCFASSMASEDSELPTVESAIESRKKDERFKNCKDIVRVPCKKSTKASTRPPKHMNHVQVYRLNDNSKDKIPTPFMSFQKAFGDHSALMAQIGKQNFRRPTPIQAQMWPVLMNGIDCIGISQTGSGKTLGFLLPAFLHIEAQYKCYQNDEKKPCPSVLILTPTRELAAQIENEVKKYSYNGYKSVCLYGGVAPREQIDVCRRGVEIVVATPGRLADLADKGIISLPTVSYVVIDEADRMLDLGFQPSIRRLMYEIRPDRIVALTSATWPEGVRTLAQKYTKDAVMVVVGSLNLEVCSAVKQNFEFWESDKKFDRLCGIVNYLRAIYRNRFKMIIFVKKKAMVDFISSELCKYGIHAQGMHGGRSQMDRENVFEELKRGLCQVLVATDVVSRGIDIADITHVLNYDFPGDIEEYVHRVGRTGRAGRIGQAMTFISWCDRMHAAQLISILEKSGQEVPYQLRRLAECHAEKEAKFGPFIPKKFTYRETEGFILRQGIRNT